MIKNFFEYLKNSVSTENAELITFKIYFKLIGMCYLFLFVSSFLTAILMLIIQVFFFRRFHFFIYLSIIPLFALIYYTINQLHFPIEVIDNFVKSKFKYVFHLSAIIFGMLHLSNYETIYWWMIAMIPLLTAPYISMGYVFGYARMKYGFANGWLMHSTINFISVFLAMPKHWF